MKNTQLPKHIAFIVDGNRRWAKQHNMPVIAGHAQVANKTLNDIVFHCLRLGIPYLTFWAFSTENWKRGELFATSLFSLLKKILTKSTKQYTEAGIKLNTIGDLSKIPSDLVRSITQLKEQSKENAKLTVTIALNYGGRDEILRAVKKLVHENKGNLETIASFTEADFARHLDTYPIPDPDLIIRTGGEQRLSGFLPWQSQYAELYFTKTLMPDFTIEKFEKALEDYRSRSRRFGK
jgi:undecaprenyl diphosphate synthase